MLHHVFDKLSDIFTAITNVITNHSTVRIEDHYYTVGVGASFQHTPGTRVGSSNSIGATSFVILSNASVVQPSVGQAMHVTSTSANDASAGTGIQQITIDYFTAPSGTTGWLKKSEVVTLNGTTAVTTANNDIYRIDRVHTNRAGSNGVAVGTITIKDTTDTNLYAQIDVGNNIFERAIHYIPKGYIAILSDATAGVSTAGGVIFRIFATEEDSNGNTVTVGQISVEMNGPATTDRSFVLPLAISNSNGKNKSIGIAVKSRTGTQSATGTLVFHDAPTIA